MEATVSYMLRVQKYISSNQKTQDYTLCLGNTSKYFRISNTKKQDEKEV